MIVVEIPGMDGAPDIRAAALGTCRLVASLKSLRATDEFSVVASPHHKSPTVGEALQGLEIMMDETAIPSGLVPYIFVTGEYLPNPPGFRRSVSKGIDVVIAEIATSRQFYFDDIPLEEVLIGRELVRPFRSALGKWFRDISLTGVISHACLQSTMEKPREEGDQGAEIADLLRGICLERLGAEQLTSGLQTIMAKAPGGQNIASPSVH